MDQLQQTVRVCAGVSLFAVICLFIDLKRTWPTMRKSPSRIILWWTISTTISLPAMLISREYVPQTASEQISPMCRFQGTLLTFGLLSSICWAGCIAVNLLIAIKWKFDVKALMNVEKTYHMLCWGFPALTAVILLFVPDVYGDSVFWCWIDARYEWLRMVLVNIPSLFTMVSSIVIYGLVAKEISRTFNHSSCISSHAEGNYLEVQKRRIQATNRFSLKCSLYLLAFILSHSGEVTLYIALIISPNPPFTIFEMMAVTIPGSGAFIAIAYFATRLLKPPKGCFSSRDSFYSGGSKHMSRIDLPVIGSAGGYSGRSIVSDLSDGTYMNDSPIDGGSRGSIIPAPFIPSLPPSVYHPNV